jgi:hypothetical protein
MASLKVYSKKDFIKLLKYFIRNKSIFLFTSSIAKAISNDEIMFEDKELKDILNELCILLNMFSSEITKLINIGKKNNYLFIKVPVIPVDLTRDVDVIPHNSHPTDIKSQFFNIFFDVYSFNGLQHQYQLDLHNISQLKGSHILRTRELLYPVIKDGDFKVEIRKVSVQGLNEHIDYYLFIKNIAENGFILYYDYLNLRQYKNILKSLVMEKLLDYYLIRFPLSKSYPSLLLRSVSSSTLFRFLKMITNTDYTPVYGNMIGYVRKVASDLGLKKLVDALFE